jgi:hypothetical protein
MAMTDLEDVWVGLDDEAEQTGVHIDDHDWVGKEDLVTDERPDLHHGRVDVHAPAEREPCVERVNLVHGQMQAAVRRAACDAQAGDAGRCRHACSRALRCTVDEQRDRERTEDARDVHLARRGRRVSVPGAGAGVALGLGLGPGDPPEEEVAGRVECREQVARQPRERADAARRGVLDACDAGGGEPGDRAGLDDRRAVEHDRARGRRVGGRPAPVEARRADGSGLELAQGRAREVVERGREREAAVDDRALEDGTPGPATTGGGFKPAACLRCEGELKRQSRRRRRLLTARRERTSSGSRKVTKSRRRSFGRGRPCMSGCWITYSCRPGWLIELDGREREGDEQGKQALVARVYLRSRSTL